MEAEGEGDVALAITDVVDVDLVADVIAEAVEVRAARGILERHVVGDQHHVVRVVGRLKGIEVGVVGERVLRDQRSFPMARGAGGQRGQRQPERCRGDYGQQNAVSHD